MRRYLACIGFAALLNACTQAQSLRDTRATGYYVGTVSVGDVADCVSTAWSNKSPHVEVVPLFGGTSVQLQDNTQGTLVALVDVVATGQSTTAKYYSKSGVSSEYSNEVMNCMHATRSIP